VGIEDSSDRELGSKWLSVRPLAYPARVEPLEAVAEVLRPRADSTTGPKVSVWVEIVASEPAQAAHQSSAAAAVPMLEARAGWRDFEAAQRTAATTAAALSQTRGPLAYAAAAQMLDTDTLSRGVCVRRRA
jgi:hypothetical protein